MAIHRVNEVASLINQQVEFHEEIQVQLLKVEAIASVALSEDFINYKQSIVHAYIWTLCDMITKVKQLHEQSLSVLLNTVNKVGFHNNEFKAD